MEKSSMHRSQAPNWYRGLDTRTQGDYFGSLSSLYPNEVFLTADKKWIVTRSPDGSVSVTQNVCAHAGAALLSTPGTQHQQARQIVCPIHKWTYSLSGDLLGGPKFEKCKHMALSRPKFNIWKGYILGYSKEELHALEKFGESLSLPKDFLSAENFHFEKEIVYNLPYPRPLMKINYDDGYHVASYHKDTFAAVIDDSVYDWEFGPADTNCSYSIQVVRAKTDAEIDQVLRRSKKERDALGWVNFHLWLKEVLPNVETPIDSNIFAVWASVYGNGYIMPELYEGGRFLAMSYLVTEDDDKSGIQNRNFVEFYVHKSVPDNLRAEALDKFICAYEQSAREDDEICEILWLGHQRDDIEFQRVYHETLEAGETHYHNWFLRHFVT